MKKLLLAAIVSLFFTGTALAFPIAPNTWTETLNFDQYIASQSSISFTHDIKNDDFTPFQDIVTSYGLTIGIYDDRDRLREGFSETVFFDLPGVLSDEVNTYWFDWSYVNESLGMSFLGLAQLNIFGTLDVTVKSLWGDFYLDYSTLVADGYSPVPEPGTLLLLGTGLAGLALYRRRSMNK